MAIKSPDTAEVCIYAKADLDLPYITQLTSLLMEDWEIAIVKISSIGDTRNGKGSVRITITFDVSTSGQLEIT